MVRALRPRVLAKARAIVACPSADERELLADWLSSEDFDPVRLPSPLSAAGQIAERGAALLVTELGFALRDGLLQVWRSRYPKTPLLVVGDSDLSAQTRMENLGAIYLERPLDRAHVVCMAQIAVLEGRPPRKSPRKQANVAAVVNGVRARIVDVSNEGLRLEMPGSRIAPPPPPVFKVTVPLLGAAFTVQRMWTGAHADPSYRWCGGALAGGNGRADRIWRSLVEMAAATDERVTDSLQLR
jgi:hypothetical protein